MSKNIQFHIPTPCHENWDKMKTVEKGRFCGSCQKQVIDFTTMNDAQLVAFFNKPMRSLSKDGSVCGRFIHDQLDRTIDIPKKRIPWVKYFFQFALPAFLISSKAVAQGQVKMLTGDTVIVPKAKIDEIGKVAAIEIEKRIIGKVIDDNGEGIPYASVFIKETTIGVATDSTGNFVIRYRGKGKSLVLVSSSIGFLEMERIVDINKEREAINISLIPNNTLGEVVVVGFTEVKGRFVAGGISVIKKTNILDTICNKIFPQKQSLKLYPNPLKRNTSLTIEMYKHEEGTHLFQLSAVNGQIILNKEMWIDENSRVVKLDIPTVAIGAYLLKVINKQTGKSNTQKIIVE